MAISIGGVSLPGPADVLDAIRGVTGWGAEATEMLAGLPARADALIGSAEQLIRTIDEVAARADRLVRRIEEVSDRAGTLVGELESLNESVGQLLILYGPLAADAAPLARRFVEELSEAEIVAAIRLVDQLPVLAEHMETDIMPILNTLDHVGPDINELLAVAKEVRTALDGLPGMGLLRRRAARRADDD